MTRPPGFPGTLSSRQGRDVTRVPAVTTSGHTTDVTPLKFGFDPPAAPLLAGGTPTLKLALIAGPSPDEGRLRPAVFPWHVTRTLAHTQWARPDSAAARVAWVEALSAHPNGLSDGAVGAVLCLGTAAGRVVDTLDSLAPNDLTPDQRKRWSFSGRFQMLSKGEL